MLATASLLLVLASVAAAQGQGEKVSDTATRMASPQVRGYGVITTDELFNMLKSKDFTLVNVHVPYEGELPQTDVFIPYDRIDQFLDRLPADKNAKVVLYCKMGKKSIIAAEPLVKLGYTNVWGMKGGMVEWRQKGYPIINASFKSN
jgi:rhodanese-related sulfurtransferase